MRYSRKKYASGGSLKKKTKEQKYREKDLYYAEKDMGAFIDNKSELERLGAPQFIIDRADQQIGFKQARREELMQQPLLPEGIGGNFTKSIIPKGGRQQRKWGGTIGTVAGGIAGSFVGNPMLGAQLGGAIGGKVDSNMADKASRELQQERDRKMFYKSLQVDPNEVYTSQSNGFYGADGGKMPLGVANNADVNDIGKTSGKFVGASHENGGIPTDFDGDGMEESEVEGEEVFSDEMLFSKRLKFSSNYKTTAKEYNLGLTNKTSYAQEAERLTRKLAKYEEMEEESNPATRNTGKIMGERINSLLNILFTDQEIKKSKRNLD
jgi:hypothetical protein